MDKKPKNISLKAILVIIALGIWVLILQNAIIHKNQTVYVRGGNIEAEVRGSVNVNNTVDVYIEGQRFTLDVYDKNSW
jgi:hypothetical protein